jgi:hypothetical protein
MSLFDSLKTLKPEGHPPQAPPPPARPDWDQAEAERLVAEVRSQIERVRHHDFAGRPPAVLENVLADALDMAREYDRRGRLDLLRRLPGHVRRLADNAKGLHPADAIPTEAEVALAARDLEQVMGLPAGSTVLLDPHRRSPEG